MRVAIIGAGMAGLAAARELKAKGQEVTVYEKLTRAGGRVATRVIDSYVFDTGATSVAPRGRSIERVMLQELDRSELVKVEKPIWVHSFLRVAPGDPSRAKIDRYTYRSGNRLLPEMIAADLDVRYESDVVGVEKANGAYRVLGDTFDAVVVSAPAPEAAPILESMGESRRIAFVSYRPCLSVLLGYEREVPDVNYHAIVDPEQRHPLTWLSLECVKCPARCPEGGTTMVAQLSPQFSAMHFESEDGAIVAATVDYIERLYGNEWDSPKVFDVKRWQYSQPESLALFDSVNAAGNKVVLAGDALLGGRVEYAYETGVRAAALLTEGL